MKFFALNFCVALLLAVSWPALGVDRVFNVRDHGAKGDGHANDRAALQSAIDACAKAGGGTVRLTFRVPQADSYARRSKPVDGNRTTQDAPDARDLRVENVSVEIAEPAFRQFDRAAFCGRFIAGGELANILRMPGPDAGKLPVIDLKNCRDVTVAGP